MQIENSTISDNSFFGIIFMAQKNVLFESRFTFVTLQVSGFVGGHAYRVQIYKKKQKITSHKLFS